MYDGMRKSPCQSWARKLWVSSATHSVGPSPGSQCTALSCGTIE